MFKIRAKRALQKRIFIYNDEIEYHNEQYKKWHSPDLSHCYFAMFSRYRTSYRRGDQLLNSYGARDNRFLLTNYGFTLRQNKFNSLGFKVFLNFNEEGRKESHTKIIRMKKNKLSEELLQYLRASFIFSYRKKHGNQRNNQLKQLLVSVPVDCNFEKYVIS